MKNHNHPAALAIHVNLLTHGSLTDDISLWMPGIKLTTVKKEYSIQIINQLEMSNDPLKYTTTLDSP